MADDVTNDVTNDATEEVKDVKKPVVPVVEDDGLPNDVAALKAMVKDLQAQLATPKITSSNRL